ncbi:MAG: hypothetical protein KIT84_42205 [Labilithrix sp.]|nr:hypothetical protein [Labilithrix sp.]MCW5817689.1 hypothetical protein [Labilithrix sp.]
MNEEVLLLPIASAAERRLGRLHVWAAFRQRAAVVAVAAAMGAALRPFVWPLQYQSPALSAARALAFAAAGALVATTVIVVRAWRSRPSLLVATRKIDAELGLAEVVASGVAFERDRRDDEMARFAIARARRATEGIDPKRLFTAQPIDRPRGFRLMIAVAAAGILFGAIDRLVVERAMRPVTESERSAAADLKANAVAAAKTDPSAPAPSPQEQQMIEAAKRAAEAAERGDRKGANEALEEMRKAERSLQADERDRAKSLRALRDELEAKQPSESTARPSTASESAAALEREIDKATAPEDLAKLAERLERAEKAAREAASRAGSAAAKEAWQRAADALKEAREAAARGDKEGAKRAMERAQRELASMESASKQKSASASRLGEKGAELDRSLRGKAREGKDPAEGGKENGEAGGANAKSDEQKGQPGGTGGGEEEGDRTPVAPKDRLKLNGDLQARADVKEGEKAVSVIEGMGKGGDPKDYKAIFPAYDTVVEDGLREDNVPAARRPTVRRYFKSIRPGEEGSP